MVCSEVEVIAVCWDRLKRLDEAALGRVMRYLSERAERWHQQPSEDFSVNAAKESTYCAKREARTEAGRTDACMAQNDHRDPRIHASDLLDPRKAYWDRQHPVEPSTRMVGHFFVGRCSTRSSSPR